MQVVKKQLRVLEAQVAKLTADVAAKQETNDKVDRTIGCAQFTTIHATTLYGC